MANVGLHLRIMQDFRQVLTRAQELCLPVYQSFLIHQVTGNYITPTQQELELSRHICRDFAYRFLHASYYINLAKARFAYQSLLKKELVLAKQLGFSHIILHPGAAISAKKEHRVTALETIARVLNAVFKQEHEVSLVLENSAHGNKALGGDLQELAFVRSLLDKPERLLFCIDTAHAYAYGYDIASSEGQKDFIEQIEKLLTKQAVALIHLNDTKEALGSKIDCHSILGQGLLGYSVLESFMQHFLPDMPVILELPIIDLAHELHLVELVKTWQTKRKLVL